MNYSEKMLRRQAMIWCDQTNAFLPTSENPKTWNPSVNDQGKIARMYTHRGHAATSLKTCSPAQLSKLRSMGVRIVMARVTPDFNETYPV